MNLYEDIIYLKEVEFLPVTEPASPGGSDGFLAAKTSTWFAVLESIISSRVPGRKIRFGKELHRFSQTLEQLGAIGR